jgi:hypothetical protein
MQERRAQGLCYNCDEKYIAGHKCATRKFLLLLDDEIEDSTSAEQTEEMELPTEELYLQLLPQALKGKPSPKTLRFKGKICELGVTILIDTGSNHNILQPRIANHLKLHTDPCPEFSVMVGNGSLLHCSKMCPKVPLMLQNNCFNIPFYLLPIQGADAMLVYNG